MEYFLYFIFALFLAYAVKKLFFSAYQKEEQNVQQIEVEEVLQKPEIFYEMNTHPIKLHLYPISNFQNFRMRDLYEKIVINTYWIDEPFHSSFVKVLYYVGANNFWIKSPKSKKIVINFRNFDGTELRDTALHVLDLREVLSDIVSSIYQRVYGILSKKEVQILLLSSMIYTLSKCGNLDKFSEENEDEIEVWISFVQIFCSEFSEETKSEIVPKNNLNLKLIEQVYATAIGNAREYPNHLGSDCIQVQEINILGNLQQKRLLTVQAY